MLDRNINSENYDVCKMDDAKNHLAHERDDLYKSGAELNVLYENTVEEISAERASLSLNNKRHI